MGADKLFENTPNAPKFICPNCLPKSKSLGFWWKKTSLSVRSPCRQAKSVFGQDSTSNPRTSSKTQHKRMESWPMTMLMVHLVSFLLFENSKSLIYNSLSHCLDLDLKDKRPGATSDNLIIERHGSSGWNRQHYSQTIHPTKKFLFNEFVQIFLCCDVGMIIYDLHSFGGC